MSCCHATNVFGNFVVELVFQRPGTMSAKFVQVRIRPQVFQEIRKNDKIIACDACQRILYDPENLDHPFETV